MAGRTYTAEQKAQVIGEWLAGSGLRALARAHKMPTATVQNWVRGYTRRITLPGPDLAEAFADSVYSRATEALEALGAHLRAAARPELAEASDGWTDRAAALSRIVVTLGAAIQRGQPGPIEIGSRGDTD